MACGLGNRQIWSSARRSLLSHRGGSISSHQLTEKGEMEGKVTVIAYRRTKPGKERALREVLLAVRGPTLAEKGCINYDLPESPDAPRGSRLSRELEVEGRISTRTSPLRISPPSAPKPRSCSLSPPTSRCGGEIEGN
jgi:antibiotic biosynthesis monooxygenase